MEICLPLRHCLKSIEQRGIITVRSGVSQWPSPQDNFFFKTLIDRRTVPEVENGEIEAKAMKHIDTQAGIFPPAGVGVVAMLVKSVSQILCGCHSKSQSGYPERVVSTQNLRKECDKRI